MRIHSAEAVSFEHLMEVPLDAAIVAAGYERRATALAEQLGSRPRIRIALLFTEHKVKARRRNEQVLQRLGYRFAEESAVGDEVVEKQLMDLIVKQRARRILIDYSCMTRTWYAAIIRWLRDLKGDNAKVDVYFSYTPAAFTPPTYDRPNLQVGPIRGFSRVELPDRKTALIIGLGYEANRALGIANYVEAAETYAFLAEPSIDARYVKWAHRNNQQFIAELDPGQLIRYPLLNPSWTEAMLSSLCLGLSKDYRVILAPMGPKIFTLLCLLLATRFSALDVWRVSTGEGDIYDRKALSNRIVLQVRFSSRRDRVGG